MNKTVNAEILSVGTELLLGHVTNTDARDISIVMSEIGINVLYHTVVGDNPERLRKCVQIARQRSDIIITTGGLGPTCDDLTKQILAESFGLKLVCDENEKAQLYDFLTKGKVHTPNMFQQAMLPEGCTVFHNNCGTAPGCAFEADGVTVIMLPGPPSECKAMFVESAVPYLKKFSDGHIVSHTMCVFGIGESTLDDIFAEKMNTMTNPSMAPYAKDCDCLLKFTAKAESVEEAERMLVEPMKEAASKIGDFCYGYDVECIEEAVVSLLKNNGSSIRISFAENYTGGDISKRFTDIPGSRDYFSGSYVFPDVNRIISFCNISTSDTSNLSAEDITTTEAVEIRSTTGAHVSVAVNVFLPDSEYTSEDDITIVTTLSDETDSYTKTTHHGKVRTERFIRRMAGNNAFDMLRRYLTEVSII